MYIVLGALSSPEGSLGYGPEDLWESIKFFGCGCLVENCVRHCGFEEDEGADGVVQEHGRGV